MTDAELMEAWIENTVDGLRRWGFPQLLDPPGSAGRRMRLAEMRRRNSDDEDTILELVTEADGGDEAPLRSWLSEFVERGEPIPPAFRRYAAAVIAGTRRGQKGRSSWANFSRNFAISMNIEHLVKHGFGATRNAASDWESACSIVAEALRRLGASSLSEAAVADIWTSHKKNGSLES